MLGLFLIYFIGKQFYKLAEEFNKNKWVFAILGVLTYYVGQVIFGVLIAIYDEIQGTFIIESSSDLALGLMGMPVGLLACVSLYYLLRYHWRKNKKPEENLIDEIGKF
jgi:hypothetical protein